MTWFPYYRQNAINTAGQAVQSASSLQAFDVNDTDFSDPLPIRALSSPPGSGTGALLSAVSVVDYGTVAFEVERDQVYLRSGTATPIEVHSWGAALKHRGPYTTGVVYDVNDLFDVGTVTYRTLQRFTASATLPTADTTQYKAMGGAAGTVTLLEQGAGILLEQVAGKVRVSATATGTGSGYAAILDYNTSTNAWPTVPAGITAGQPILWRGPSTASAPPVRLGDDVDLSY